MSDVQSGACQPCVDFLSPHSLVGLILASLGEASRKSASCSLTWALDRSAVVTRSSKCWSSTRTNASAAPCANLNALPTRSCPIRKKGLEQWLELNRSLASD
jgi:hypothetical protein